MSGITTAQKNAVDGYFDEQLGRRTKSSQKLDEALKVLEQTPYGPQQTLWTLRDELDDIAYHATLSSSGIVQDRFSRADCQHIVERNLDLFESDVGVACLALYRRRSDLIKPMIKREVEFYNGFAERHTTATLEHQHVLAAYLTAKATAVGLRSFWSKLGDVCLAFTSMLQHVNVQYLWSFHDDVVRYHYPHTSYNLATSDEQLKVQVHALSEAGQMLIRRIQDIRCVLGATPAQLGDHFNFGHLPTHVLSSDPNRRCAIETVAMRFNNECYDNAQQIHDQSQLRDAANEFWDELGEACLELLTLDPHAMHDPAYSYVHNALAKVHNTHGVDRRFTHCYARVMDAHWGLKQNQRYTGLMLYFQVVSLSFAGNDFVEQAGKIARIFSAQPLDPQNKPFYGELRFEFRSMQGGQLREDDQRGMRHSILWVAQKLSRVLSYDYDIDPNVRHVAHSPGVGDRRREVYRSGSSLAKVEL
ncbi:hypothetical protein JCM11491_002188 [Sporobolomyces phaffii]